jgi:hypothetical protein
LKSLLSFSNIRLIQIASLIEARINSSFAM